MNGSHKPESVDLTLLTDDQLDAVVRDRLLLWRDALDEGDEAADYLQAATKQTAAELDRRNRGLQDTIAKLRALAPKPIVGLPDAVPLTGIVDDESQVAYKPLSDREMLLVQYSEFLDGEAGVMSTPADGDFTTHHELVEKFLLHSSLSGYQQYAVKQVGVDDKPQATVGRGAIDDDLDETIRSEAYRAVGAIDTGWNAGFQAGLEWVALAASDVRLGRIPLLPPLMSGQSVQDRTDASKGGRS